MAQNMYYIRGQYVLESDFLSPREIEEQNALAKRANYARNMRIREEEEKTARRGYCPKCHLLLPLSGVCDCGYNKKEVK